MHTFIYLISSAPRNCEMCCTLQLVKGVPVMTCYDEIGNVLILCEFDLPVLSTQSDIRNDDTTGTRTAR